MPVHDWTRVIPGIFHAFHHSWIEEMQRALNSRLLPAEYYALAEQVTTEFGPDVLTLQLPDSRPVTPRPSAVATLDAAPVRTRFAMRSERPLRHGRRNRLLIRHRSGHRVVAVVEIVSPGNKQSRNAIRQFSRKLTDAIAAGVHLLVADVFPPGPRDPQGVHPLIWRRMTDEAFDLPPDRRLTMASYVAGAVKRAFVEPVAVGEELPTMPVFLDEERYVPLSLEETYNAAWAVLPPYWQEALT